MSVESKITALFPTIDNYIGTIELEEYIAIATVIAENDGISGTLLETAIAMLVIDIACLPDYDNVSSEKIDGLSISYIDKVSKSKWKLRYEMIRDGVATSDQYLFYTGIE
jgi:hypothetical protein